MAGGTRPAGASIGEALESDSVGRGYMQAIGPHSVAPSGTRMISK